MAGESKLQSKCRKEAASRRVLFRKIHAEGKRGWMDCALIFPITGETVWVEMKNPNGNGTLGKLQRRERNKVLAQNASSYVCNSFEDFCEILERHLK